jgi:hypothetical protein
MNSAPQDAPKSKKQYAKPGLKVYGSIDGLTAGIIGASPNSDGGSIGTMVKTG